MSGLKDLFAEKGAKGSSLVWLEDFLLGKIKKNYMTKEECSRKLTEMVSGGGGIHVDAPNGAYQYKGQVASYDDLPTDDMSQDTVGYTYDAKDTGMNWAWAGDHWDNLGPLYSFNGLTDEELEVLFADTNEDGVGLPETDDTIKWNYTGQPVFTVTSDTTTGNTRTVEITIGGPAVLRGLPTESFKFPGQSIDWSKNATVYAVPFIFDTGADATYYASQYTMDDSDLIGDHTGYFNYVYSNNAMSGKVYITARQLATKGIFIALAQKAATKEPGKTGNTILKKALVRLVSADTYLNLKFTINTDEFTFLDIEHEYVG